LSTGSDGDDWISFGVVDEVIEVVEKSLLVGDKEKKKELKKRLDRLLGLVEKHFLTSIIGDV
jgi:hypothetical protein